MDFDNPPHGWTQWEYRAPYVGENAADKRWLVEVSTSRCYCVPCDRHFHTLHSIAGHNAWHNRQVVAA